MKTTTENVDRWIVQAANTGGIAALSMCQALLEKDEQFELCAEIREAIAIIDPDHEPIFWKTPMSAKAKNELSNMVGGTSALNGAGEFAIDILTNLKIRPTK